MQTASEFLSSFLLFHWWISIIASVLLVDFSSVHIISCKNMDLLFTSTILHNILKTISTYTEVLI
jgi:hypothetical protein